MECIRRDATGRKALDDDGIGWDGYGALVVVVFVTSLLLLLFARIIMRSQEEVVVN